MPPENPKPVRPNPNDVDPRQVPTALAASLRRIGIGGGPQAAGLTDPIETLRDDVRRIVDGDAGCGVGLRGAVGNGGGLADADGGGVRVDVGVVVV